MPDERASIDLCAVHGAAELILRQVSQTAAAGMIFFIFFCSNQNRQLMVKKGDDKSKTYACPQDGCTCEVSMTKRVRSDSSPEHYISTLKISR